MKIIFFTKYSKLGASSRLRSYQYFSLLRNDGIEVVAKPLFDSEYIKSILNKNKSVVKVIRSYFNRFFLLFTLHKYDNVVIEKELFPYLPSFFEKTILLFGIKYTVIYDDAIFHNYDMNPSKIIRFLYKKKIDAIMRYSSCVIVGNNYLKKRALDAGAKKIVIIPTVIDLDKYRISKKQKNSTVIIGWIGSPSTFHYLKLIEKSLKKIISKYDVKIHIIGAKEKLNIDKKHINYIQWSEESEVDEIQKFTVGIMPLKYSPWALGKCSYKLIQYMGCAVPVIASPVGMNIEIVKHNDNGYLAKNQEDWYASFEKIINDTVNSEKMGRQGRIMVENKFSLKKSYKDFKDSIIITTV